MNCVPSCFVFWCCDKASPKETLGRMAYRAPRFRFQSIIARKLKRRDLEAAGHITHTTKTRGAGDECTHTCQYSALLHFYRVWDPGRGVSNFILCLFISINVIKIIPINMCMGHFFPMPHVFVRCISSSQTAEAGLRLSITCRHKFRFPTYAWSLFSGLLALGAMIVVERGTKQFFVEILSVKCRESQLRKLSSTTLWRIMYTLPPWLLCQVRCHLSTWGLAFK